MALVMDKPHGTLDFILTVGYRFALLFLQSLTRPNPASSRSPRVPGSLRITAAVPALPALATSQGRRCHLVSITNDCISRLLPPAPGKQVAPIFLSYENKTWKCRCSRRKA